jgi:arsenite methyltransferase
MLPIHKIIWYEWREKTDPVRLPEPSEAMDDLDQIRSYVKAYEWGGPTSALQLHHLQQLATLIRPGDTVLDLACGPGPLLLELAPLYPSCRFVGADLSNSMLEVLRQTAAERSIQNIETLCEDIRTLPGLKARTVDMVITTSALHHLPDIESLRRVFERIETLLKPDGGLYVFDFGLLKSQRARDLMVAEIARKAPPITVQDYANSLRAAFPIDDVLQLARQCLHRPLESRCSSFVDFFYFLRTPDRSLPSKTANSYADGIARICGPQIKLERQMLRLLQRAR